MRKTYKFRLYPTKRQIEALDSQLAEACRLYNAALQERRDAWRLSRKSISLYDQTYQLKEIRAAGDIALPNFDTALDVLQRVDKTFKAFFRRVKRKEKAGFPRWKSARRYDSLTYGHYGNGCKLLDGGKLRLQGIGEVKLKLHRAIEGKIKTLTIKREAGRWFACFSVECEPKPLPVSTETVGIDVGLTSFATLSDGTEIENPRYFVEAQKRLRRTQRKVARRKKGSNRRRKAVRVLARQHLHIRNQRNNFQHERSRWLVNNHGLIAAEDLNIRGLAKSRLAKSISDAGWGMFLDKIAYKAAEAGRVFVKVNPSGTSQNCSGCGHKQVKTLAEREHKCESCGLVLGRDHNAAINILGRGLRLQASTCPVAECVA